MGPIFCDRKPGGCPEQFRPAETWGSSKLLTNETSNTSSEKIQFGKSWDVAFDTLLGLSLQLVFAATVVAGMQMLKQSASYATSRLNWKGLLTPATQPGSAATQGPGPPHFFRAFRNRGPCGGKRAPDFPEANSR